MKRILFGTTLLTLVAGSGWVIAETASPAPKGGVPATAAPHDHDHGAAGGAKPASDGMMCGKMMGNGMGPMMMGEGMRPMMMGGAATRMAVKNVDKGVTITFTTDDAAMAGRLQKMAEGMRLMHEAMTADH
ncbi:MAG TPA: hypothetical protein VGP07_00535 [Polyangia bacterium]